MILGHLEDLQVTARSRYHTTICFCGDLLSGECSDLLVGHSMFLWRRQCDHARPEPGRGRIIERGSVLGRDAIVVLLQNILCLWYALRQGAQRVLPRRIRKPVVLEVQMKMSTRFFEMLRMIGRLRSDLPLLGRLLKAWKDGSYRGLSMRTLASLVGTLLYVVSPIDLIPDFIPGVGFIDDAAVLALLLHSLAQDLVAFRIWEERRGNG